MAQSELSNVWLTVCARSSDPLCIVSYYVKWATTSWTEGKLLEHKDHKEHVYTCITARDSRISRRYIYAISTFFLV